MTVNSACGGTVSDSLPGKPADSSNSSMAVSVASTLISTLTNALANLSANLSANPLANATAFVNVLPKQPTSLRECWFYEQSGPGEATPAVSDSQVFFSTGSGEVLARDQRSGKLIWKTSVANEAVGGRQIRLSNNVLFVPISYETVGLDARDGKILWRYQAPADSFATPHAYPGYVVSSIPDADVSQAFLPAWGGSVSSLHLQSGQVQWTWRLAAHSRSGAAGVRAVGDTIYVATWQYENASGTLGRPKLTALDRATGHELWAISLPLHFPGIAVQGAPVVYGPLIFLSGSGGYLWAIDRTTRAIRWRFIPNSPRTATITQSAVFDHTIYHYGGDERLYAIDAVSGRTVWVSNIPAMITRDLLVTPKRVYAIHGSSLYVYDRLSGRFILEQVVPHTNDGIYSSSLAYANGRIFVTTSAGAQCFFEP